MPDRERVTEHLNDCLVASRRDNTWVFVRKDIVEDALTLLKKQDAKTGHWNGPECSCCHAILERRCRFEYCPHCGAKMEGD